MRKVLREEVDLFFIHMEELWKDRGRKIGENRENRGRKYGGNNKNINLKVYSIFFMT